MTSFIPERKRVVFDAFSASKESFGSRIYLLFFQQKSKQKQEELDDLEKE